MNYGYAAVGRRTDALRCIWMVCKTVVQAVLKGHHVVDAEWEREVIVAASEGPFAKRYPGPGLRVSLYLRDPHWEQLDD